jgi:hypothetical protein
MSQETFATIFMIAIICGLPLSAGVATVAGIWLLRRWSMRGFESAILLDGAACLKTDDGKIVFKQRAVRNWLILIGLGLGLIAVGLGTVLWIGDMWSGANIAPRGLVWGLIVAALMIGFAFLSTLSSLRQPPILINSASRFIEVGQGLSVGQIPFSNLSHIALTSRVGPWKETIIYIQGILNNDLRIPFGSVSGSKAEARANTIAQLIADVTGAPILQ